MPVSEDIRKFIEKSGESLGAIGRATGIATSVLSRFMAGHTALSAANLDKLADYFGLKLTKAPRRKGSR